MATHAEGQSSDFLQQFIKKNTYFVEQRTFVNQNVLLHNTLKLKLMPPYQHRDH